MSGYKKNWIQKIISLFLILLIIFIGFKLSEYLHKTKRLPKRKKIREVATYVETVKVKKVNTNYEIITFGSVLPEKFVTLSPEVSGKVVYVTPKFFNGGYIKKGDVIIKIEDIDYKIDVIKKTTILNSLKEDLKIEIGKQKAAINEYNTASKFLKKIDNDSLYLILRKPYIKKIKEQIKKAKQDLKLAKIRLKRTVIKAPFNCYIVKRYTNIGSFVSPNMKIADIIYSDFYYVISEIPVSELNWLDNISKTKVKIIINNKTFSGKIISISPVLEKKGLMANAIIEVKNDKNILSPLKIYNYAKVEIYGKQLRGITKIPLRALREDNRVWIYENNRLKITKVNIVFEDLNNFYTYNIRENTEVITSHISAPVEGMKLFKTNNE